MPRYTTSSFHQSINQFIYTHQRCHHSGQVRSPWKTPITTHFYHLTAYLSTESHRVAGHTADYVNRILRNVANGVPRGGIESSVNIQ